MTELQRVPRPRAPFSGHEEALVLAVVMGLLVVTVKPWGSGTDRPSSTPPPSATPSPRPTPPPDARADDGYGFDAGLYGAFEPPPDWSIWPAGYFISVQYVTRAPTDQPRPSASVGPSPEVDPTASLRAEGPLWPSTVEIGVGDHLLWLGVNTPQGWAVSGVTVRRAQADGRLADVRVVRLPSPWGDHFTVLALPTAGTGARLAEWPPGDYWLTISVEPGGSEQTILVRVRTGEDRLGRPGDGDLP